MTKQYLSTSGPIVPLVVVLGGQESFLGKKLEGINSKVVSYFSQRKIIRVKIPWQ